MRQVVVDRAHRKAHLLSDGGGRDTLGPKLQDLIAPVYQLIAAHAPVPLADLALAAAIRCA
jgi:hypothetical protein